MTVFADSSALVKLYADEEGHERVRALDAMVVSAIARVEAPAALWRKNRLGELTASDARLLVRAFEFDLASSGGRLVALPLTNEILETAAELTATHGLRADDAVQLASARAARLIEPECSTFAAFDGELTEAAVREGSRSSGERERPRRDRGSARRGIRSPFRNRHEDEHRWTPGCRRTGFVVGCGYRQSTGIGEVAMSDELFLKIDGIPGESADDRHREEIEVDSWSWGLSSPSRPGSGGGGGGAGRVGKVEVADLTFTHRLDVASPRLMDACATARRVENAVLTARRAGGDVQDYLMVRLDEVRVSAVSVDAAASADLDELGRPAEQVTLAFSAIRVEYRRQAPDGSLQAPVVFEWSLQARQLKAHDT